MIFIGFDNGVTSEGIGVVSSNDTYLPALYKLPVKKELSYTKEAKNISRIDFDELCIVIETIISLSEDKKVIVGLERPMVNSARFNASLSAVRALESTLIVLEKYKLPYQYIDSKEWQKLLLPKNLKGTDQLKQASLDIGRRLFPHIKLKKDADGLLIAEYLKRTYN